MVKNSHVKFLAENKGNCKAYFCNKLVLTLTKEKNFSILICQPETVLNDQHLEQMELLSLGKI